MPSSAFVTPAITSHPHHYSSQLQNRQKSRPCNPFSIPKSTLLSPTQTQTPLIPTPSVFPAVRSHALANNPNWRYVGAPLHKGPLPAVIYFALSATQSLELDPFNQVVSALLDTAPRDSLRVFSVTLPFHGEDMAQNEKAFERWRSVYEAGGDPVSSMVRRASNVLGQLVDTGYVRKREIVAAGLSRGGLLAALLAVRNDHVRACVEFAPVTVLGDLPEFSNETVQGGKAREMVGRASLLTPTVVNALVRMPVRFYMGNFDRRVGTRNAFELVHLLAERAVLHERVRSPPHEFVMYCSVGKHGHGTPPDVFRAGAEYILQQLQIPKVK